MEDTVIDPTLSASAEHSTGSSIQPVRHNLPQIPTMSRNPKIAQSKTSKEEGQPEGINVVTGPIMEDDEAPDPSLIPGAGLDPADDQKDIGSPTKSDGSGSSGSTPIKLKIRKSCDKGELTSSVELTRQDGKVMNIDNVAILREEIELTKSAIEEEKRKLEKKKGRRKRHDKDEGEKIANPEEKAQRIAGMIVEEIEKKIEKVKSQPHEMDSKLPTKWLVGDLVWSKVTGHPWWPCMVSFDPVQGVFTKVMGAKAFRRMYHVQFFGQDAERGWVGEKSMLDYTSQEAFENYARQCIENASTKTAKTEMTKYFEVGARRRLAWDTAVRDIETAFKMDRNERKAKYTFSYQPPKSKGKSSAKDTPQNTPNENKRKATKRRPSTSAVSDTMSDSESAPKRKRTSVSKPTDTTNSSVPISPPKKMNAKEKNAFQFTVFVEKHKEQVKEEHPDFDDDTVNEYLSNQWSTMSDSAKSRYKAKFIPLGSSATTTPAPAAVKGKTQRISKPPKKRAEDYIEMHDAPAVPKKSSKRTKTSTSSEVGMDDVVASVAAGAGQLPDPTTMDPESEVFEEPPKNEAPVRVGYSKEDPNYELEIFKLFSSGPVKKENYCQICEQPQGEMVQCQGACYNAFHLTCLGIITAPPEGTFKCEECSSGIHSCFVCKETSQAVKKCSVPYCGKFYHEGCVNQLPLTKSEGKGFTCPLHVCVTCANGNAKCVKATKGRFFRCIRCPSAYHVGDFCIAAGSVPLGGYNIVCSSHFQPVKTQSHHAPIHVSWCFICNRGGTLLCCDSCPAAFHADCLKINPPDGAWFCRECSLGKKPLYGDIVWVKLGSYRWWPAEVCHPANVPLNIQDKSHQVGEFPVRFFGSHDFFWTHQARVFLFHEGDKGSRDSANAKGLAKIFKRALVEAVEAFKIWKKAKESKAQEEVEKNDKKPAPFKFVRTNIPYGNVQLEKPDIANLPRCECQPNQDNPCGDDKECLNRMMLYECHPQTCPAGEKCQNQRFQKRQYPETQSFRTDARGWGLKANVDIKKGQFVHEYVGELVDEEECRHRIQYAHENNISNFYMLTIDKQRIIDAGPKGNLSRFMNHCCQPNLETQKWNVNGNIRVGLFASEDIAAGGELTFNYNLDCLGNEKTVCRCGAPNCSGFLGVRPKTAAAAANEKKVKDAKKRRKRKPKADVSKTKEDFCYRCGEGGDLVICDRSKCSKVYHLSCLKLEKPPSGKWVCPWHHCDECGKPSVKLCTECPNSFCTSHVEGNIIAANDGTLFCLDHEDILETLKNSAADGTSGITPVSGIDQSKSTSMTSSDNSSQSSESSEASRSSAVELGADNISATVENTQKESDAPIQEVAPKEQKKAAKASKRAQKNKTNKVVLPNGISKNSVVNANSDDEDDHLVIDVPGL